MKVNCKRLLLCCVVVWVLILLSDWLFHGLILKSMYAAEPSLWRTQAEMAAKQPWMLLGQLIMGVVFCLIFLGGYEDRGPAEGLRCGLLVGLFVAGSKFIVYAVLPIAFNLAMAWVLGAIVQWLIVGVVVALLYRPVAKSCGDEPTGELPNLASSDSDEAFQG